MNNKIDYSKRHWKPHSRSQPNKANKSVSNTQRTIKKNGNHGLIQIGTDGQTLHLSVLLLLLLHLHIGLLLLRLLLLLRGLLLLWLRLLLRPSLQLETLLTLLVLRQHLLQLLLHLLLLLLRLLHILPQIVQVHWWSSHTTTLGLSMTHGSTVVCCCW